MYHKMQLGKKTPSAKQQQIWNSQNTFSNNIIKLNQCMKRRMHEEPSISNWNAHEHNTFVRKVKKQTISS